MDERKIENKYKTKIMDLTKFDFKDLSEIHLGINKDLLQEAETRKKELREYRELFSTLFFRGGKVVFKKGIDEDYKNIVWGYCRNLMGSFAPKHEHKELVCAMLMSEILEPKVKA